MKRQFSFLTGFFLAMFVSFSAQAQISGIIGEPDTVNDVTATTVKINGERQGSISSFWYGKVQYQKGTAPWQNTDTLPFSAAATLFSKTVTGLDTATVYKFRIVFYSTNFIDSFVTQSKTVRTKSLPVAPEVEYLNMIIGISETKIIFSYKSFQYQSRITGKTNALSPIGDTVYVAAGSGIDTLRIAHNPSSQIPGGFLVITPQGVPLPTKQSPNNWPAFTSLGIAQPSVSGTNKSQTKYQISFDIGIITNGSYQESIVDSLVLFENGVEFLRQGIWVTNSQVFPIVRTGKKAGSIYSYSGYIKNRFGHKVWITPFSITTLAPSQGFVPVWGSNLVQTPNIIECFNIGYTNVDAGNVLLDVRKKGTQAWETFSSGSILGTGNIFSILVPNRAGNTTYELRLRGMSVDSLVLVNSDIREVTTFAALPPLLQQIVITGLVNNTVTGIATGDGNGTATQGLVELREVQGGVGILQDATLMFTLGTGSFEIPFMFQSLNHGSYELRAIVSEKETGANPYAISKFFSNTISGVEEISEEAFLQNLAWNLYDLTGKFVTTGSRAELLRKKFGGKMLLLSPVDAGFKKYAEKRLF